MTGLLKELAPKVANFPEMCKKSKKIQGKSDIFWVFGSIPYIERGANFDSQHFWLQPLYREGSHLPSVAKETGLLKELAPKVANLPKSV